MSAGMNHGTIEHKIKLFVIFTQTWLHYVWIFAIANPSSVTFVHPTQPVEIFGNVSTVKHYFFRCILILQFSCVENSQHFNLADFPVNFIKQLLYILPRILHSTPQKCQYSMQINISSSASSSCFITPYYT